MIITLKDGSKKEYAEAKSVYDIAMDITLNVLECGLLSSRQNKSSLVE